MTNASECGRLAGIDAGGSATRVIVLAEGELNALPGTPPLNAMLTPDVADRLLELIKTAKADAAGVGLPGVRTAGTAGELSRTLTERAGIPVRVTDDGTTSVLGAFRGTPGIVVHAGTGSGGCGWDGTRWARAGGRGYLLGDEGGAYWLGRAALSAALRFADGTGGSAAIAGAVAAAAGGPLPDLVRKIYTYPSERIFLTPLAPVVTSLAADGDEAALSLAHEAATHLAALVSALRRRLGDSLPVCGTGGVLSDPVIWDRFATLTGAVRPLAPPEVGAALLASGVGVSGTGDA
jgi:N-acetylglucosamine kinase-like BadF-type ATPase